jgi:hypothetical protein
VQRWLPFASLADKYRGQPVHILLANPFPFSEAVYDKVKATVERVSLVKGRTNLSVLHHAKHPAVDRHGAAFVPGWNASNNEIKTNSEHACFVLFDRSGQIAFRGRLTPEEAERRVAALLRHR